MSEDARRAAELRIPLHMKGSKWRHFAGWTVRQVVGFEKDGQRMLYDMDIEASRPITEDDMELAPPELAHQ